MRHGWRVAGLGAACAAAVMTTACGSSGTSAAEASSSASASSAEAAVSAGATAAPGTYGQPVDPSLPDPTDVATDAPAPPAYGGAAQVVVTYSGWADATEAVEFGAYVVGVAESGGTCTLTLTSESGSASAEVPAEPDSSSTSCPLMAVAGSELSPGTWSAVVTYESPSTSGESEAVEVVVP